jgi:hypothetical protein
LEERGRNAQDNDTPDEREESRTASCAGVRRVHRERVKALVDVVNVSNLVIGGPGVVADEVNEGGAASIGIGAGGAVFVAEGELAVVVGGGRRVLATGGARSAAWSADEFAATEACFLDFPAASLSAEGIKRKGKMWGETRTNPREMPPRESSIYAP